MTWHLSVPSHCLNQCWNIVNSNLRNKCQWNHKRNSYIFNEENALESVVCKMASILSQPQRVKLTEDYKAYNVNWTIIVPRYVTNLRWYLDSNCTAFQKCTWEISFTHCPPICCDVVIPKRPNAVFVEHDKHVMARTYFPKPCHLGGVWNMLKTNCYDARYHE